MIFFIFFIDCVVIIFLFDIFILLGRNIDLILYSKQSFWSTITDYVDKSGDGRNSVSSLRRVPLPPHRIATGIVFIELI
jgi:hypothetical protein